MSNQELDFDDSLFVFETVMRVRHTEIDRSQHISFEALTALLCEARHRFLHAKGIQDINADHRGLIIDGIQLTTNSRVRAREELLFEVGVEPLYDNGGHMIIKISRMYGGEVVAKARIILSATIFTSTNPPPWIKTQKRRYIRIDLGYDALDALSPYHH